ncbi:MAG TPA: TatD family hydrolase [Syntrophales bacterium]|nr:TatD family hydrolase [Syntrophales bacterium]
MEETLEIFDAHAHLNEFEDLPSAIERARAAGVIGIVAVGMDMASNLRTLEIAGQYPGYVFPALGYHPWNILESMIDENLAFFETHIDRCIAIGEVGLDYKIKVRKPLQQHVLREVARLAARSGKPLILHSRLSHERVFSIVKETGVRRAVFHWYSGPLDLLGNIVTEGYLVSATPAAATSPAHQAAIRNAPLENILLETDCPVPYGAVASEPRDVTRTLSEVARIKNLRADVVARQTTMNARAFFKLLKQASDEGLR